MLNFLRSLRRRPQRRPGCPPVQRVRLSVLASAPPDFPQRSRSRGVASLGPTGPALGWCLAPSTYPWASVFFLGNVCAGPPSTFRSESLSLYRRLYEFFTYFGCQPLRGLKTSSPLREASLSRCGAFLSSAGAQGPGGPGDWGVPRGAAKTTAPDVNQGP